MKLVNRNLALLLLAGITLVSCNDDETPTTPDNKFAVGADTYKITNGAFLKDIEPGTDGVGHEYYRNELFLAGEGITLATVDGKLTGTGDGSRILLLINNVGRDFQAGTYTWQSEANEQPFDLWAGYINIAGQNQSEVDYDLESGTLTVTKSGSTYKATFEGVAHQEDENEVEVPNSDVTVTFQYEGSLLQADAEF
jgi:hypothetical protein